MPDAIVWLYAALVGALLGSFLNVCIYRWPAEQSVIRPRSRCPRCGEGIRWFDNVPVLAWLWLRGACRSCGEPISVQYPLIELATALIWTAAAIRFGPSVDALHSALFLTILLGIAMTDAREMVIPDQFSLGGVVLGLGLAAIPGGMGLLDAAIGAAAGYGLLWLIKIVAERLLKKPALGVGDIHMIAMIGAFIGLGGMLLTIFLGSVLGLVIGVPVSWIRGRLTALNTYLPLGVFLAMGAAVAHVWGPRIIEWYMDSVVGVG
jgi:leader peptidase (prepilin peptidase)/N-methyltransferase